MKKLTRRHFLYCSAACLGSATAAQAFWPLSITKSSVCGPVDIRGKVFKGDAPDKMWKWSREGFLYKKLDNQKVVCGICPNRCMLSPGDRSVCRSKINKDGILYSLAYGNPCSVNVDPIEKKPLFHFKPRTKAFSIATTGCNFRCLNCQNWEISQAKPHEVRHHELFPGDVVAAAQRTDCESIAYTYSEPITFFEYMIEIARLARENQIKAHAFDGCSQRLGAAERVGTVQGWIADEKALVRAHGQCRADGFRDPLGSQSHHRHRTA